MTPSADWPQVIERKTGQLQPEPPWGEGALAWFYPVGREASWVARSLRWILAHTSLPHHVAGWWFSRPRSKELIPAFCEQFQVRLEDFQIPAEGWRSFNDFFMRRLNEQARPLASSPCAITCPGDGRVRAYSTTPAQLMIKGQAHDLAGFLGDPALAAEFEGGCCALVRLCPCDYHRFHFPFGGEILSQTSLPGALFSVHPWADAHVPDAWWRNARVVTVVQTPFGRYACVAIGATSVGSIQMSASAGTVETGAEWGAFALGGSALALFFKPGQVTLDADLLLNTQAGRETLTPARSQIGIWEVCPNSANFEN
jgi:phosphatidylserine decarboxylase